MNHFLSVSRTENTYTSPIGFQQKSLRSIFMSQHASDEQDGKLRENYSNGTATEGRTL